jgi:EAL domain-containing protein (putative c-di-GMP-specific phosphodiesterase class I)
MYYQPIFSIKENKFLSTEALVRLPYNGKFISPALFIPFAERFGKMNQIGNIILDKTFAFISSEEYRSSGIQYTDINLSITQLLDEKFIEKLEDKRMENHLDISEIYLELTEGVAISGDKTIEGNIYGLDKAGYHISLDDFGVGYSNIARLTKLPISLLKFDKSLVDQLSDPHIKSFLISLIKIVKNFGMEVLVEGVETKENVDFLQEHDADKIQGFYYSKPLCEKDLIEFLKQHNQ